MTDDERIKILEATLARLLQWIAAAESRISLVLGLNTAMLGALAVGTTLPGALTLGSARWRSDGIAAGAGLLQPGTSNVPAHRWP